MEETTTVVGRERMPLLYRALHTVLPPVVTAIYRPKVAGSQHIPATGPAILASNHLSFLDHFVLPAYLERPIFFLGKSDYFSGWKRYFFTNLGVVPIDREGGDAGEAALRKGQQILAQGKLLGIYPEGTRTPDGRLYRGKTGPVRLAIRAGVPIIPVAMVGLYEILPPGARLPRMRGRVEVKIGEPLDFSRYAGQDDNKVVLRSATDELMYELMLLSGQQYVDEYAASVKAGEVDIGSGSLLDLGRQVDAEKRAA